MQKGMDTLFGLIGEAVWNKLNAASAAKDSTTAAAQNQSPAAGYPDMDAMMAQQQQFMQSQQGQGMPGMAQDWAGPNQPSNMPPSWMDEYGPPAAGPQMPRRY
jgi:hypothetical protein